MSRSAVLAAYAMLVAIVAVGFAVGILTGPYRAIERSDYMTYHVAARIVVAGNGACLYDPDCQAREQRALIGVEPSFDRGALPFNSPPWLAALVAPLAWLPLAAGFAIFTLLGLAVLAWASWRLSPWSVLGAVLVLTAWPTVMGAVRGQATLLVAGLLGLSVAFARYRSGAALGLSALKPSLGPLWTLWQLTGGHWRAAMTAAAVTAVLVLLALIVVGPGAVAAYPAHLLGVAGEGALGVHPQEMVNWRGVAARLGADAWLAWPPTFLTLALVAATWLRSRDRFLGAASAFLAAPLIIPHANQHEAILGAVGVLLLVRASRAINAARWLMPLAISGHALSWAGAVLDGEASAWLLFAALLAFLALTTWLAWRHPGPSA